MKIIIGCDHNAYELKKIIIEHLIQKEIEVEDIGCHGDEVVLYPNIAQEVAARISKGDFERGILLCGTGIGMSITANKVPGVRAAVCHDMYSTARARKSNNAQILTMGSQVIGPILAKELIDVWLVSEFQGGRSKPKVDLIDEIDNKYKVKLPYNSSL